MSVEHLEIDEVSRQRLTDVFAVVSEVRSTTDTRQYRRRVHLSLTAAQKAAQRAQERGLQARIVLCQLRPVDEAGEWS